MYVEHKRNCKAYPYDELDFLGPCNCGASKKNDRIDTIIEILEQLIK